LELPHHRHHHHSRSYNDRNNKYNIIYTYNTILLYASTRTRCPISSYARAHVISEHLEVDTSAAALECFYFVWSSFSARDILKNRNRNVSNNNRSTVGQLVIFVLALAGSPGRPPHTSTTATTAATTMLFRKNGRTGEKNCVWKKKNRALTDEWKTVTRRVRVVVIRASAQDIISGIYT